MFATVIPNTAFAQDSSNQVPSEQVEFADIYIGDELITVPVVIESEIAGKTARSGVQYEDTIESATYYIPVTEEGKVYNDEFQRKAFRRYQQNTDMFEKMMSEPGYMEDFMTSMFKFIYDKLKNKEEK
mgnify:CR=1 FL=1